MAAPVSPTEFVSSIPVWVDLVAVAVGAASGSLVAATKRYDLSGILVLSIVTGLGGGMIRDTLLQRSTPVALTEPGLLLTAVLVAVVTFTFVGTVNDLTARFKLVLAMLDTAVLGVFTIVGTAKGLDANLPAISCVLLGVVTGVGGGLMRDVLVVTEPEILRPGTLYALAGTAGAAVYVALVRVANLREWIGVACILLVVLVRGVSMWRGWTSPEPTDLFQRSRLAWRARGGRGPTPD